MTTLFHEDDAQPDREVTLGMGSLLSIFFGVVLVCGIFFGFGYSMGRRNVQPGAVATAAKKPAAPAAAPANQSDTVSEAKPGPHDIAPLPKSVATTPAPEGAKSAGKTSKQSSAASSDEGSATPATKKPATPVPDAAPPPSSSPATLAAVPFAHRPTLPGKPRAGIGASGPPPAAPTDEEPAPGHPVMVQIAAVSRQEDAEVLAGALRKRGFAPQVKSGTTDKFFHVQVGPFTDKAQAESMKQHLLADGYNAILK